MRIQLNGQNVLFDDSETLELLLKEQSIETAGVAVAVNGQIVFRSDWGSTKIAEGDQIEIVHAVSGG